MTLPPEASAAPDSDPRREAGTAAAPLGAADAVVPAEAGPLSDRIAAALAGLEDGKVRLVMPDGEAVLPLETIQKAKLVLTDELLAAAAGGSTQ